MDWKKLLSARRLGRTAEKTPVPGRSPFQQDFDRISFSAAFRRLQDKAQVFPLAENAYVRTRLTHSLEVACVGRSLGAGAGVYICGRYQPPAIQPSDIGAIVAAASLAHDIGNPPLGHSGEETIRDWFCHSALGRAMSSKMTDREQADIVNYEGNAQGFRVLARLQMPDNYGGMQLTCATLAAFAKYPVEAINIDPSRGVGTKKFNFFQDDRELFAQVAAHTGLRRLPGQDYGWYRHPLVFLVEAADDISYHIVDFEDGHMLGIISYDEIQELFMSVIADPGVMKSVDTLRDPVRKVEFMRARAISKLIEEVVEAFKTHHDRILAGELTEPLVKLIPSAAALRTIQERSREDVYTYQRAVEIEAAGFELTEGLLDTFAAAMNDCAEAGLQGKTLSYRSRKILQLIPAQYWRTADPEWLNRSYIRLLNLLDFISGMTDSYAVALYKKIKGISLPSGNL
ncbi:MAG: deoxyguanosinetriphosphate triphosphohydrolase [Victivallaceae bacterium]|nr:deoxyguanosinetriphosphate triphosphohydrolase [Victivallaceae bacterium]